MPFDRVIDLLIKEALGSIRNRKTVEKIFQNRKTAKKIFPLFVKKRGTIHNGFLRSLSFFHCRRVEYVGGYSSQTDRPKCSTLHVACRAGVILASDMTFKAIHGLALTYIMDLVSVKKKSP